jgi:hypothetical protein
MVFLCRGGAGAVLDVDTWQRHRCGPLIVKNAQHMPGGIDRLEASRFDLPDGADQMSAVVDGEGHARQLLGFSFHGALSVN